MTMYDGKAACTSCVPVLNEVCNCAQYKGTGKSMQGGLQGCQCTVEVYVV